MYSVSLIIASFCYLLRVLGTGGIITFHAVVMFPWC